MLSSIIQHRRIDVTSLPLVRRKELLSEAFEDNEHYSHYSKVQYIQGSNIAYFEAIQQHGLEGIVIKDLQSRYSLRQRTRAFQKVSNWTYAEVFISGVKKDGYGWLTSMQNDQGQFRSTGIIEFSMLFDH